MVVVVVAGVWVRVVTVADPQLTEVSSPIFARENLFCIRTAALLDTPTIPVIKISYKYVINNIVKKKKKKKYLLGCLFLDR